MSNAVTGRPASFAAAFCGFALGVLFLKTLPIAEKNPAFLLALPLMCLLALGLVLQPRAVVALLIFARVLLDPVLNLTKSGGGLGFGAVLNFAVVAMTLLFVMGVPGIFRSSIVRAWLLFLFIGALSMAFSPDRMSSFRLLF